MKKIILTILLFSLPSVSFAALARIQATSGNDTTFASSCKTTAFGSSLTNPSIILFAEEIDTGALNSGSTPTDTAGNTYVRVLSKSLAGVFDLEIWYALNTHTTGSNVITAGDTAGGVDTVCAAEEWTGAATVLPVDQSASATGSGTTLDSGSTAATTNANDIIWGAGVSAVSGNHMVLGAGFSNLTQNSTTFSNVGIESKTVSATGTYNATLTNSSASWVMGVVAIKDNGDGGGGGAVVPSFSVFGPLQVFGPLKI